MRRNKLLHSHADTDPLSGVANLFDVAMVFAVALLVALVSRSGLTEELLRTKDFTLVKNPGQADMEIITRQGKEIKRYAPDREAETNGQRGHKIGIAYQLETGEIIYVPEEQTGTDQ